MPTTTAVPFDGNVPTMITDVLGDLGLIRSARFIAQEALSHLDSEERRVQIRDRVYDPNVVKPLAVHLSSGGASKPIIFTKDRWIVDGNTTIKAAREARLATLPAVELGHAWETADEATRYLIKLAAARLNATHGSPLTTNERLRAVREMLKMGATEEVIRANLSLTEKNIRRLRAMMRAEDKLARLGITDRVSAALLAGLGTYAANLNDDPFRMVYALTKGAGLRQTELKDLCERVRATNSDAAATALLEQEGIALAERMVQHALTGNGGPSIAHQLRMHLGFVNERANNPGAMVERNGGHVDSHMEAIEGALAVLRQVLTMQREVLA